MVRFLLNGTPVSLDQVDPHLTFLQWLRSSGLTGSKEGCAEGECGACAVAVLRADSRGGARYDAVNSCLLPLASVSGRSIVTVEGVADPGGSLHPVQTAMIEQAGSQCGYCTPGFVVSLFCEYYRPGRAGYDPESISGNLCRCTGYRPIADVARALPAPAVGDPRLPLLREPVPVLGPLHHVYAEPLAVDSSSALRSPAEVRASTGEPRDAASQRSFVRPTDLGSLFEHWASFPEATLIAGGTDLMVYANQRQQRWPHLISLEALSELTHFVCTESELIVGAGLPLAALEELLTHELSGRLPALEQLLPLFSSRLIRNRATLGGSLVTASPIGDAAPVLLALDAELTLVSRAGERRIALHEFFRGYRQTALGRQELVRSIHVPLPGPFSTRFYKVSKRVLDDISTVAAAFALSLDDAGRVTRLRIAYGGIAATPVRALAAEQQAEGAPWDADTLGLLLAALSALGTPQDDHRGQASYRRAMVGRLLQKFFAETTGAEP